MIVQKCPKYIFLSKFTACQRSKVGIIDPYYIGMISHSCRSCNAGQVQRWVYFFVFLLFHAVGTFFFTTCRYHFLSTSMICPNSHKSKRSSSCRTSVGVLVFCAKLIGKHLTTDYCLTPVQVNHMIQSSILSQIPMTSTKQHIGGEIADVIVVFL